MKLLLLVIGCCVALAVSKPAEDACAAMRARLLPSLEPPARADAGALRACDADSDGAVDAAELVSCVQRAFGNTARLDPAEIEERIQCFRGLISPFGALEGSQMMDNEQEPQLTGSTFFAATGVSKRSVEVPNMVCAQQNQLGEILVAIAHAQLQAAYDKLIYWYISILSESSPLNGFLQNVSFILQVLLSGRSFKSLVYLVTEFARSANNSLTVPVEDALISSLFQISSGNFVSAKIIIQVRLTAGVLNPVTQDELQRIIDAFDAGSSEGAATRIISLLAGCDTSSAASSDRIFPQLLALYDKVAQIDNFTQIGAEFGDLRNQFLIIVNQTQNTQQVLEYEQVNSILEFVRTIGVARWLDILYQVPGLLLAPCNFPPEFASNIANVIAYMIVLRSKSTLSLLLGYPDQEPFSEPLTHIRLAEEAFDNSDFDGVFENFRPIFVTCVSMTDL